MASTLTPTSVPTSMPTPTSTSMATPRKRTDLSIAKKVELLRYMDSTGASQSVIAKKFGVSSSQVSRLVRSKDQLYADYEKGNKHRKRLRCGKDGGVGEALFLWFQQVANHGNRLSGPILKAKARELGVSLGIQFEPSEGWLNRWKVRYNILLKKQNHEREPPEMSSARECKAEEITEECRAHDITQILNQYGAQDVFNVMEARLFFRAYPETGFIMEGANFPGGKKAKEPMTALLCTNMSGTEKIPLLVIGESNRRHSFPRDMRKLPVLYDSSPDALMTPDIFRKWLQDWDVKLWSQNRHICLFVNTSAAHPKDIELFNIDLKFFQPNAIVEQPMDMGIIENWKGHYRSKLSTRITAALAADENACVADVTNSVSILDALYLARQSWEAVNPGIIVNCFMKAGFLSADDDMEDDATFEDVLFGVPIPDHISKQEFLKFVNVDYGVDVCREFSGVELFGMAGACSSQPVSSHNDVIDLSDTEDDQPLTSKEKILMIDLLRRFLLQNGCSLDNLSFSQIERLAYSQVTRAKKQRTSNASLTT